MQSKMEAFLKTEGFRRIYLRMVPLIYQREPTELLDYYLYKNEYTCYSELNYYLPLARYHISPSRSQPVLIHRWVSRPPGVCSGKISR